MCRRLLMPRSPGRPHSSMCHCRRLTSSGVAQLSTQPQPQVTDPAVCPAQISCLDSVARCSCMSFETKLDLLSDRARPIAPLPNVARKAPSLAPARGPFDRQSAHQAPQPRSVARPRPRRARRRALPGARSTRRSRARPPRQPPSPPRKLPTPPRQPPPPRRPGQGSPLTWNVLAS